MKIFLIALLVSVLLVGLTGASEAQTLEAQRAAIIAEIQDTPTSRRYRDARADLFLDLARVEVDMRQYRLAEGSLEEAQILYRKTRNRAGQAYVHTVQGDIARFQAKYETGYVHYQEALSLFLKAKEEEGRAETLWRMGELFRYQRKNRTAISYLEEARDVFLRLGLYGGAGKSTSSLAQIEHLEGRHAQAYGAFIQSAGYFEAASDVYYAAEAYFYAAATQTRPGGYEAALSNYLKALSGYRTSGAREMEGRTLLSLARVETVLYKDGDAEGHLLEARSVFQTIRNAEGEADALRALGNLSRSLGENQDARSYFSEAAGLYRLAANPEKLSGLLQALADVERQFGLPSQARDYYLEALVLYERQQNLLGQANVWLGLGLVDSGPNPDLALSHFAKSAELYNAAGRGVAADMAIEAANRLKADISR